MFDSVSFQHDQIWMIVVGFIIAFILAFGIGANDVANSFGTSVGAKVLTLRQAFVLACIFETLGAVLLGAKVSDTIRKGIIDIAPYENASSLLMVGNVAALSGSCVWLIAATLLRLPVSATHSIVGSTVGFALVAHGARGIQWYKLAMIILSWFISPILAGIVSVSLFFICRYFILNKTDQLEPGLRFLPIFYAATIVINLFSVFYDGPEMLGFDKIPLWGTFIISFGCGAMSAVITRMLVVPWQRRRIKAAIYTASQYTVDNGEMVLSDAEKTCYKNNQRDGATSDNCTLDKGPKLQMAYGKGKKKSKRPPAVKPNLSQTPLVDGDSHSGSVTPVGSPTTELNMQLVRSGLTDIQDESNDTVLTNGQSETVNHNNVTCGNGGISNNAAASDTPTCDEEVAAIEQGRLKVKDTPEAIRLFSFLQILTAVFGAFAHGGNDVSNAIGPLISLWLIGTTGVVSQTAHTPIFILLYGGIAISLGLCILGYRVIKTIGEDLTKITPSSGFCIEIGSALTVLVASNVGIPISTTHCKVGSVVFVGRFRARENVDWSIFRNIVIAWLVTLPISGGISAAIMAGLRLAV